MAAGDSASAWTAAIGSLQGVGAEAARLEGSLRECRSLGDLLPVPESAVLLVEQNEFSGGRGSGGATGFLQQHEGKQAQHFGLWGWQLLQEAVQEPAQANRLAGQLGPGHLRSRCGRVALVEDQIHDL